MDLFLGRMLMKRSTIICLGVLLLSFLLVFSAGCGKKVQPAPPPPPAPEPAPEPIPPAQPTITLTASPDSIKKDAETTLSWKSTDADSVVINSGVGNVATSGSVKVSPIESTTYTAVARGEGGEATASTRVTVIMEAPKVVVKETDLEVLQKAMRDGLIKPVFFDYDKSDLSESTKATLEENARWFRQYQDAQIIVEGHCDERGTEEYNLALGDRRAQATRDYLIELGVSSSRLEAVSYGEERPFVQGSNEATWAQNRRAHFSLK